MAQNCWANTAAHERAAKAIYQINLLFLSGWIALIIADKISLSSCLVIAKVTVPCLIHLACVSLVLWIDWRLIKNGTKFSELISTRFESNIRSLKVQRFYETQLAIENLNDVTRQGTMQNLLEETSKNEAAAKEYSKQISEAKTESNRSLRMGVCAIFLFVGSLIVSIALMISLLSHS